VTSPTELDLELLPGTGCVSAENLIDYESEMTALELPSISFIAQGGSPQRSIRERPEIRRSSEHFFFLLLHSASLVCQACHAHSIGPGDLVFYDSNYPLECDFRLRWRAFILRLSTSLCATGYLTLDGWRAMHFRPVQVGPRSGGYVAQLSPEFVVQAPLPQTMLTINSERFWP